MSDPTRLLRLSQQLANEPHRGDIRYLLGAEHASMGNFELAIEEMTRALRLDPLLHTARLQLGLLFLTCGRPTDAVVTWRELDCLSDNEPLRMFARGLEALIRDDFSTCIQWLEMGIRANHTNAPLNRDMAMVIDRIRSGISPIAGGPTEPDAPPVHVDFSLYGAKKP